MNNKKKLTIVFIIIFIILILLYLFLKNEVDKLEEKQSINENSIEVISKEKENTLDGVIKKYKGEYISEKSNRIFLNFAKDLYDENGNSNEEYFEKMIEDIIKLKEFENSDFHLIDEDKKITIDVFNTNKDKPEILYNKTEDFYSQSNGENYAIIDKIEIMEIKPITIISKELRKLIDGNMFFRFIKDELGEGIELKNGYTSFKDGEILLKILNSKVRNIVFTKKYPSEIINNIKVGTNLEKVKEVCKDASKENNTEKYILYRTADVYIFFYEDEVSAYGYSYFENTLFEEYLEQYLEDKNLDEFVTKVLKKWTNYDKNEYDPDKQNAHITFPSRGVEIKIDNNNSYGITLYNNYFFTEKSKEFVKSGKIQINAEEDLLELMEINRRNNL